MVGISATNTCSGGTCAASTFGCGSCAGLVMGQSFSPVFEVEPRRIESTTGSAFNEKFSKPVTIFSYSVSLPNMQITCQTHVRVNCY